MTQVIIVSQIVGECSKAADPVQAAPLDRYGGTKGIGGLLHLAGDQYQGSKSGVDEQGFEERGERGGRAPTVRAGHEPYCRVSERRNERAQKAGLDTYIAIGDDTQVVPGCLR